MRRTIFLAFLCLSLLYLRPEIPTSHREDAARVTATGEGTPDTAPGTPAEPPARFDLPLPRLRFAFPEGLPGPSRDPSFLSRTLELLDRCRLRDALAELRVAGLGPGDYGYHVVLGRYHMMRYEPSDALDHLKKAVNLNGDGAEAYYFAGLLRRDYTENAKEAARFFAHSIENGQGPLRLPAAVEYARSVNWHFTHESPAEGVEAYLRDFRAMFFRMGFRTDDVDLLTGEYLASNLRHEQAAEYLQKSLSRNPSRSDAHLALGRVYEAMGRRDAATRLYASARGDDAYGASYHLGQIYRQAGDTENSIRNFEALLSDCSQLPGSRRLLAESLIQAEEYDRAAELLEEERALFPHVPGSEVLLAQVRIRQGDYEESVRLLEPLARERGIVGLARILRRRGDFTEAERVARRGLEMGIRSLHSELTCIRERILMSRSCP